MGWIFWAWLNWVVGLESHKSEIKVSAELYLFLELGDLFQTYVVVGRISFLWL